MSCDLALSIIQPFVGVTLSVYAARYSIKSIYSIIRLIRLLAWLFVIQFAAGFGLILFTCNFEIVDALIKAVGVGIISIIAFFVFRIVLKKINYKF